MTYIQLPSQPVICKPNPRLILEAHTHTHTRHRTARNKTCKLSICRKDVCILSKRDEVTEQAQTLPKSRLRPRMTSHRSALRTIPHSKSIFEQGLRCSLSGKVGAKSMAANSATTNHLHARSRFSKYWWLLVQSLDSWDLLTSIMRAMEWLGCSYLPNLKAAVLCML